ncbi:Hypothetical protein FKW44_023842, partial [Caligus rogercresseyi]
NPVHPSSRGRAAHKGRIGARKKISAARDGGLGARRRRLLPPPGFILPGDPILVVLRHNGGASESTTEAGLDGSHGARINPPCEADDEEDNYPDGVQLQIEA